MGYIRHHSIIVTSWSGADASIAHEVAQQFFGDLVSPIVRSKINGYESFFIATDGSKEGWETSDDGDDNRRSFIEWLAEQEYGDGSSNYSWVEVQYGDDELETKVTDSSDDRFKSKEQPSD